jgi:hypothetical protein
MTADFRGGADGPDNGAQPAPGKLSFRGASARHSARAIPAAWAERLWGWLRLCLNGQDLAELSPAAGGVVRPGADCNLPPDRSLTSSAEYRYPLIGVASCAQQLADVYLTTRLLPGFTHAADNVLAASVNACVRTIRSQE